MIRLLKFTALLTLLAACFTVSCVLNVAKADELPIDGTEIRWEHGPLLTCFAPEPLIAALQPGVQGLPTECLTLTPPIVFIVHGAPLWTGEFVWEGAPIIVGVFAFQIEGNPVTLFTALTARP